MGKEDFATLAGKSKDNAGPDFKYDYSYEEIGLLFQKYAPSWRIEIEKYFTLVLFNYAFSNRDAHVKNFSLLETESGDYTNRHTGKERERQHQSTFLDEATKKAYVRHYQTKRNS